MLILKEKKQIPKEILEQTIDFTKNFTNVCHHGKEEDSLFPNLEKNGMSREGGPIARMIFEHNVTNELAEKMEISSSKYIDTGDTTDLVRDIQNYLEHVGAHLSKENLRLFVMADMILGKQVQNINEDLENIEKKKLTELGKNREHYEKLVENLEEKLSSLH